MINDWVWAITMIPDPNFEQLLIDLGYVMY